MTDETMPHQPETIPAADTFDMASSRLAVAVQAACGEAFLAGYRAALGPNVHFTIDRVVAKFSAWLNGKDMDAL